MTETKQQVATAQIVRPKWQDDESPTVGEIYDRCAKRLLELRASKRKYEGAIRPLKTIKYTAQTGPDSFIELVDHIYDPLEFIPGDRERILMEKAELQGRACGAKRILTLRQSIPGQPVDDLKRWHDELQHIVDKIGGGFRFCNRQPGFLRHDGRTIDHEWQRDEKCPTGAEFHILNPGAIIYAEAHMRPVSDSGAYCPVVKHAIGFPEYEPVENILPAFARRFGIDRTRAKWTIDREHTVATGKTLREYTTRDRIRLDIDQIVSEKTV